jgi:cytochrome P450
MSPSTTPPGWREQDPASVAAGEPFIVDGSVIPPGTQVGISSYTLHHNADYFPDTFTFRPERWLEEDKEKLSAMRSCFAPFSLGDRSCAGKPMAYLELSLTVAKVVWYFYFEKAEGEAGRLGEETRRYGRTQEFMLYDSIVVQHDGPNLVFKSREGYHKELD